MASYLYVLSIGPVQDFIAAARRTRDLWFGSHLLSEISKAAAREVSGHGELIFPGLNAGDKELEPNSKPGAFNVANIILAKLDENPIKINELAQEAARKEWMRYAQGAKDLADHLDPEFVSDERWSEQIHDVIEFYSAWMPFSDDHYRESRIRLMRLLDGRKAIRNFDQPKRHPGIPKCSLDGARDSIIEKDKEIPKELALKMRLQAGEQLCAIGLTKRLGVKRIDSMRRYENELPEVFPSVVRIAMDPWIRGIQSDEEASQILKEIEDICKDNGNISQGTGKLYYQKFPFDGQVLHISRINSMVKAHERKYGVNNGWEAYFTKRDFNDLEKIKSLVERLQKKKKISGPKFFGLGEPCRYFAILVADGDRMGKMISARVKLEEHQNLSKKLAEFAKEARRIVDDDNHGCLIYSGGDDVLAFVPLDFCLKAARDLHDCFGKHLEKFSYNEGDKTIKPSLSVGIAIGHSMEPLEDLLSAGREAEKAAKKGTGPDDEKDGLAVHLYPRSGTHIKIRERWDPVGQISLDKRLLKWAEMHYKDMLPDGAAYDMHELAEDYRDWKGTTKAQLEKLIIADCWRLLNRKKAGSTSSEALKLDHIEYLLAGVDSYEKIKMRSDELILSRQIASAMKQSKWNIQKEKEIN